MEINDIDFEQDQQEIIEKTDISTLSRYCLMLQNLEDQMLNMEKDLKKLKEEAELHHSICNDKGCSVPNVPKLCRAFESMDDEIYMELELVRGGGADGEPERRGDGARGLDDLANDCAGARLGLVPGLADFDFARIVCITTCWPPRPGCCCHTDDSVVRSCS